MIQSKKELEFYLMADRIMNRGTTHRSIKDRIKEIFLPDYIMEYLVHLRKFEFYSHKSGLFHMILSYYHGYRYRKLGIRLGFSIAKDVFGYGLVIPHYGTIVVGGGNKIGNFSVLHTSICITNGKKNIGDGLYVSTGAKLTTMDCLGDNVTIASNSVVTNSFRASNVLLAGMPAAIKKDMSPWYSCDSKRLQNVMNIKDRWNLIFDSNNRFS